MAKKNGSDLKIEKGVPLPEGGGYNKRGYAIVMRKLAVGDSILFHEAAAAHNAVRYVGGNKTTHTCRKTPEGYRVWRIK